LKFVKKSSDDTEPPYFVNSYDKQLCDWTGNLFYHELVTVKTKCWSKRQKGRWTNTVWLWIWL